MDNLRCLEFENVVHKGNEIRSVENKRGKSSCCKIVLDEHKGTSCGIFGPYHIPVQKPEFWFQIKNILKCLGWAPGRSPKLGGS